MKFLPRALAVVVPFAAVLGMSSSAFAGSLNIPHGQKAAFFSSGTGSAGWVNGSDPLVAGDTDGKVIQLSSPTYSLSDSPYNYGGFVAHALDGMPVSSINALSYDFQVTTPGWTGGGLGSPRLIVDFTDGSGVVGNIALNPVDNLTSGTWYSLNATTGGVDVSGGTCGYMYQATWGSWQPCFTGDKVADAYVVNDSGWGSNGSFTVQVDNLTLNNTVYSAPASAKR
jgi:hypothetical protein